MSAEPARRVRRAARLLVENDDGTVLLFRFTPPGRTPLWATPGGECDENEAFYEAARRELLEETGFEQQPSEAIAERHHDFITSDGEPVTAHEVWFHVRVADRLISTARQSGPELRVMQSHRWFSRKELANWPEPIFPPDIRVILAKASTA